MLRKEKREKRNKEIIKLYDSGLTLREIGKRVGLSRQGVLNVINNYGIKTRSISKAFVVSKREEDEKIIQLWREGYTKNRIMSELSLSWVRINNAFKRMGLVYTTPPCCSCKYIEKEKVREYAINNPLKSQKDIGEFFGISQNYVSEIISDLPHLRNNAAIQKRIEEYKGESVAEIATKYNISFVAASYFIKNHILPSVSESIK